MKGSKGESSVLDPRIDELSQSPLQDQRQDGPQMRNSRIKARPLTPNDQFADSVCVWQLIRWLSCFENDFDSGGHSLGDNFNSFMPFMVRLSLGFFALFMRLATPSNCCGAPGRGCFAQLHRTDQRSEQFAENLTASFHQV